MLFACSAHSALCGKRSGVGQMMVVCVSGSSGGEFVVVVGEIFGDDAK